MEKKVRKHKQYHSENCDSCVRGVYTLDYRTKVIVNGHYAHKWSINIIKTVFGQEYIERHEFSSGKLCRKALAHVLRKNKPNQIK